MKLTRIRMVKSNGEMFLGSSYNIEETKAYRLIEQGFAVYETKPGEPSEIKPAAPSEIKAKKKRSRARTGSES